jgi:hypothetical protein
MITNAIEFPCVEASRCYLTEKEHGLRLTLKQSKMKDGSMHYELGLTKNRGKQEEWYAHIDTTAATTETPSMMRTLQLRHCTTGQYLYSDSTGHVGTQPSATDWTTWILEPNTTEENNNNNNNNHIINNDSNNNNTNISSSSDDFNHPLLFGLISKAHAPRQFTYTGSDGLLSSGDFKFITRANTNTTTYGECSVWELEFTSGELCFMSNPVLHCQIRCNVFGQLSLSNKFQGWEVFRFIEVGQGNVAISSWTHAHKFLSSNPDGKVVTTENRLGHWEKWKLAKAEHGVYIISVAHEGRYLSIGKRDHEVLHTTTKPNDYAKWHLDVAHSHTYFLSTVVPSSDTATAKRYASSTFRVVDVDPF